MLPEHLAERVRNFPDSGPRFDGGDDRGKEVRGAAGSASDIVHRVCPLLSVAGATERTYMLYLLCLERWVDLEHVNGCRFVGREAVDADNGRVTRVDRPLSPIGRLLNLTLDEAGLDSA